MTTGQRSVLLAAGGTGGHLFPAFALAEELGRRGYEIDLATDMRGDRYGTGFPARAIHNIPSATLAARTPGAVARTGFALSRGLYAALNLIKRLRPAAVVGFGGYPTFPPLLAARLLRVPSVLHEQNAVLGRANTMLARRATAIATSFPRTKRLPDGAAGRVRFTGNPVRQVVIDAAAEPFRAADAGDRFDLLIFGGSQGARFFSDTLPPALTGLEAAQKARLRVTQQAREEDVERVTAAYAQAGIEAEIAPFFRDLPRRIAASQLVVGRAGASTVAELAAIGRPSILVPLPHSLDNDQLENATSLSAGGGGWCVEQRDFTAEEARRMIAELMASPDLLRRAAASAREQGRADAVVRLADLVVELIDHRAGVQSSVA